MKSALPVLTSFLGVEGGLISAENGGLQ